MRIASNMGILKNKRLYLYVGLLGVMAICVNVPFDLELAPERKLQVVSSDGHPLPGALVRQIWYQYSLRERGEVQFQANDKGEVLLPKRTVQTSILALFRGAINEIRETGIHASFFSDENIIVLAEGYPPHIFFDGKGLKGGKAVIKKGPPERTIIGSDR
jgi:hypothetical protein